MIRHVKVCHDYKFYGINCLEMGNKLGFFKDENDVRPSSAFWIDRKIAETLMTIYYNHFIDLIGEASLNTAVIDRNILLDLLEGEHDATN